MQPIGRGDRDNAGSSAVKTWQLLLVRLGFAITADGIFGPRTEEATRNAQLRAGLPVTGIVDGPTWALTKIQPATGANVIHDPFEDDRPHFNTKPLITKYVEAEHYRKVSDRVIQKLVLHTMEWAERSNTAEACAAMFHRPGLRGGKPIITSAHLCSDNDSVIQCVPFRHVAFAAPGANADGIHIEQAGFARQTADDWRDPFSSSMLELVAKLIAALSADFGIPLERLTTSEIANNPGARGVCTHHDCTIAFKTAGGHTDPGPNYPLEEVLEHARSLV